MVITVQGYNGKKNKATMTASLIAGMSAMKKGLKTLVVELIDKDYDTVERMLKGTGTATSLIGGNDTTLTEEGIDALLREVDAVKLMKADFDQYCNPVLKAENRLDIANATNSTTFTTQLLNRLDAVKNLIENAKDVYEFIVILLPTGNEEITKAVNEMKASNGTPLIDKSVYCIHQGFHKKASVYGNQIYYVITDYEDTSVFIGKDMAKDFIKDKKKEHIYKINHSVSAYDACLKGTLANYIRINRDLNENDTHYDWIKDMAMLTNALSGDSEYETNYEWEKLEDEKETKPLENFSLHLRQDDLEIISDTIKTDIKKEKKGFSLFGKKKKQEEELPEPEQIDVSSIVLTDEECQRTLDRQEEIERLEDEALAEDEKDENFRKTEQEFLRMQLKRQKELEAQFGVDANDEGVFLSDLENVVDFNEELKEEAPKEKTYKKKKSLLDKKKEKKEEAKVVEVAEEKDEVKEIEALFKEAEQEPEEAVKEPTPNKAKTPTPKKEEEEKNETIPSEKKKKNRLVKKNGKVVGLYVDDKKYASIAEASRAYNMNYAKVCSRLKAGWTVQETFELE